MLEASRCEEGTGLNRLAAAEHGHAEQRRVTVAAVHCCQMGTKANN